MSSPEVYHRPVLSMPPVILMGGPAAGGPGFASIFGGGHASVPPSPIVEMPPSPAPSHMMVIEFPADDDDDDEDEDEEGDEDQLDDVGLQLRADVFSVHEVRTLTKNTEIQYAILPAL